MDGAADGAAAVADGWNPPCLPLPLGLTCGALVNAPVGASRVPVGCSKAPVPVGRP
jgi:hypothetical protein